MEPRTAHRTAETEYDRETREYNDLTTQLAEAIDGQMRTPFEHQFNGRDFISNDGSVLRDTVEDGLESADDLADQKPNLAFEVRRRRLEVDEAYDMIKMAHGTLPNTMIVISDFPAELMDATENLGGYNVIRKQAMLRVLAYRDGVMYMYSQTLDLSDREGLESLYSAMGCPKPREGELLGQRIHVDLDQEQQEMITDQLTYAYDQTLAKKYGGQWYAGREQEAEYVPINTYDFVLQQRDILQHVLVQQRNGGWIDMYDVAALLDQRLARHNRIAYDEDPFVPFDQNNDIPYALQTAGEKARSEGKSYSACGVEFDSNTKLNGKEELAAAGYGNKTDEETTYRFDKRMHCVVCQSPPKKGDTKRMCGPCGICQACDAKLKVQ